MYIYIYIYIYICVYTYIYTYICAQLNLDSIVRSQVMRQLHKIVLHVASGTLHATGDSGLIPNAGTLSLG